METQDKAMAGSGREGSRWLWLGSMTLFALMSLASGKVLVGAGFLLLGLFAFFNSPLQPGSSSLASPSPVLVLSWACGLVGIALILLVAGRAVL